MTQYATNFADYLTEAQMVALTEAFGGTRLYIPRKPVAHHAIAEAIGQEAFQNLVDAIGYGLIRVPVARELRAQHYRAAGMSYAQIARKLGLSETGVDKMFKRISEKG